MRILYMLDDELGVSEPLQIWFEMKGYQVNSFTQSTELIKLIAKAKPDIVLMDVNLSGEDGRNTCRFLKKKYRNSFPIILFSATSEYEKDYKMCGADAFIPKPFRLGQMADMVASLIAQ